MPQFEEDARFPVRKSPRLRSFDYSSPNYYFITVCTKDKKKLFWDNDCCNAFGSIAENAFASISDHFPGVRVDKYVVMPNHIHAIIVLEENCAALPVIVGQYKSHVTRLIRRQSPALPVWQDSFHDHVIRNQTGYEKIWRYIEENPAKWKDDCFYCE